jgi:hypothetical protein
MRKTLVRTRLRLAALPMTVVLAVGAGGSVARAQDPSTAPSPAVMPVLPAGDPLGVPYGEWAGRWWQWLLRIPTAENPIMGGACEAGQAGPVFFLPRPPSGATVSLDCEVDADQWILVNAGSTLTMGDEGDPEQLRSDVVAERAGFSDVTVTVDGVPVPDPDDYWVVSSPFELSFGEDNLFGFEPGSSSNAVAGGWFVMIPPLDTGTHTIVVHTEAAVDDDEDVAPSVTELTAIITVPSGESPTAP